MMGRMMLGMAALVMSAGMASAAERETKSGSSNPDKMICVKMAETGSRLSRGKACHTAAEWEARKRESQQQIEKIQAARGVGSSS